MLRKLLMGGTSGERTLVSTTEPHTSLQRMDTPITMKVGASYSIIWKGTASQGGTKYPFEIYGGDSVLSDMCSVRITTGTSAITIISSLFGIRANAITISTTSFFDIELKFTVVKVSTTNPLYTLNSELYIGGSLVSTENGIETSKSAGDGLRFYENLAGTFIIKKLS